MNDVRTRIVVCCYRGRVGTDNRQQYGYVHHSLFYRTYCVFRRIYIIQQL